MYRSALSSRLHARAIRDQSSLASLPVRIECESTFPTIEISRWAISCRDISSVKKAQGFCSTDAT